MHVVAPPPSDHSTLKKITIEIAACIAGNLTPIAKEMCWASSIPNVVPRSMLPLAWVVQNFVVVIVF